MKAIIVDDEQESILALQIKLEACNTHVEVVETLTDSRMVVPFLEKHQIDILFLDVEMPGLNGLALLDLIENREFEVILVTAYSEYALKAIKASALDYLMKPVDIDELEIALLKAEKRRNSDFKNTDIAMQLSKITTFLQQSIPFTSKLALSSINETYYVAPDDIIYIVGDNNYCTFVLQDGREIVVCKTIKEYETILSQNQFFRVHKSYLINLDQVNKLNKGLDLSVEMSNNVNVDISFRKKAEFFRIMKGRTQ